MERRTLSPRAYALDSLSLDAPHDPVPELLRRLTDRPGLIALDSVRGVPRRWSIIGFDPFVDFSDSEAAPTSLDELGALLDACALSEPSDDARGEPFMGGFLGALSYELGVRGEALALPEPAWPQPLIAGGLYRDWVVVEHPANGQPAAVRLMVSEDSADRDAGAMASRRAEALVDLLQRPASKATSEDGLEAGAAPGERTVSRAVHCERVEGARALIAKGEIYQANVSHRMLAAAPGDPLALYLRLRETNPGPYMGFLRFHHAGQDHALLSSSPELLLELSENRDGQRIARTRPIKGTVARGADPEADEANRAALLASEKDIAELAMIVDLERNDLGRIAEPGGVSVGPFPELETYAAVHHLVADVTAKVAPGLGAVDVVASVFPGGSITGAPKLRSMEAIAELEEEGRGFFTGSMGFIDLRGRVALSILIRTMIHRVDPASDHSGAEVSFHVGGGITWNSDPGLEDDETLWKAAGLLRALAAIAP
jgi:para-aminobenzoate synthetase component 1